MKIVIVDDHSLFRVGVRLVLAAIPDFQLVGEAGTADQGLAIIEVEQPRVVLMDISLPAMDGLAATREIVRRAPGTRVLIVSMHDQIRDVLDALGAGASGYALKAEKPEQLVTAIRTVARGERYLAAGLAAAVSTYETRRRTASDVLGILSERERTVFGLASECLVAREIAHLLGISRKTVDTHLYRIHHKLGLRSSAELVRLAASLGLVSGRGVAGGETDAGLLGAGDPGAVDLVAAAGGPGGRWRSDGGTPIAAAITEDG